MTKLILYITLLVASISFGEFEDTSFRLPTKKDIVKYYKTQSVKHMMDSLKENNLAAIIESGCYDVKISSDSKGVIKFQLKEKK